MRAWLYRAFPDGFGSWYPDYVFDEQTLEAAGLRDERVRAVSTHWIRRFPSILCGRNVHYFTMLRNPVDHVLSWIRYNYQLKMRDEKWPASSGGSIREFVGHLMDRPHNEPFRENMQTNFFALYTWCEMQPARHECEPAKYQFWSRKMREAYERERLPIAKDVLRSFLSVGVVEHIIDSLDLLRDRAARAGFWLRPSQELTFENVTRVKMDDDAWIGDHDPVGHRLLESIREDEELYMYARRLIEEARPSIRAYKRPVLRVV